MRQLSGLEVVRALQKAGFSIARVSGSHHILKKDGHAHTVSVPVHRGKDIKSGTLRGLIRSAGLTVEQFQRLIE